MTAPRPTTAETCKSCGQHIVWAVTAKGHRIPLDPEPSARGNLRLEVQATGLPVAAHDPDGEVRFLSHFATCPNAASHRHARARGELRKGARA